MPMIKAGLLTEAGQQPLNLKHFVVDNQCYQTVETMPMVNQDRADYAAMARAGESLKFPCDELAPPVLWIERSFHF